MTGTHAPYGTWTSPIQAADVARPDGRPSWPSVHDDTTWWCASRPAEDGRVTLMRRHGDGPPETVLPAPWNARSRVHEYGGRPFVVLPDATVVFAEFSDQRLYRFAPGSEPRPISPAPDVASGQRYVEPFLSPSGDEVWCILEEHHSTDPLDLARAIVAVPLDGSAAEDEGAVRVVATDRRFLACPQVSPDGSRLSWITWDHPDMPWDSTELRVARLGAAGTAEDASTVAGGRDVSVPQACWLDDSTLLAAIDADGWWNLHRVDVATGRTDNVCRRDEEFAGPLWVLGMRWFACVGDGRVAVLHGVGAQRLGFLDLATGDVEDVVTPFTEWAGMLATDGSRIVCPAGAADRPMQMVEVTVGSAGWRPVSSVEEPEQSDADKVRYLPVPEARTFAAADGRDVHADVYRPRNPDFSGPEGDRAPYVVFVHGGPTSRVPMVQDWGIGYFTSRGIGVVEVNYGGSTGFGREYRNRLRESWGIVDVEDSVAVAKALVAEGLADPERLAIRGGSAGGWTSAAALTSTDVFACGTVMFPILDLAAWRTGETHDFESQYLDSLVGPWPQTKDRYVERSPINRTEHLKTPFLLLQGLEDVICPPEQCDRFLEKIADSGVPHAYLAFEGEQHGFRKADTIVTALEAELSLYGQVFGFDPGVPRVDLQG